MYMYIPIIASLGVESSEGGGMDILSASKFLNLASKSSELAET